MSATDHVQDVAWDLDPLVDGEGEAGADRLLAEADERAAAFAAAHQGKVSELDGPGLAAAMAELQTIVDLVGRAGSYAGLRFAVDTADPANGALMARVQEQGTQVETKLLFFELEWAALDDERVEELLKADGLETSRHHLRTIRRYRPHLLSEPEERLLSEKSVTGRDAWTRLFSELTSAVRVHLDDSAAGRRAARRRPQPPGLPRPRACAARPPRRSPRRCSPACARARTCSTRCWPTRPPTTGCATTPPG